MMKRICWKSPRLVAVLGLMLFMAGCYDVPGPYSVPNIYSVVPSVDERRADVTDRLLELQKAAPREYRISSGDTFSIMVYEHPELELKQVMVTPDGYLSAPLIGAAKVGGLTLPEAHELLRTKYNVYIKNTLVSLMPLSVTGHMFSIAGRVNMPGNYPIPRRDFRVLDALAAARGLATGIFHGDEVDAADLDNAYMLRDGKKLPVNFAVLIHNGNPLHNIPVLDGDYIYIPSQMSTAVYVLGEVAGPTYVGYRDGMTLLTAVSFARGFNDDTRSRYCHVIRGGLTNPRMYKIDIDKIVNGEAVDFQLQANDVIWVPKSDLAAWNRWVRQVVPTLQSLSMMAGPFGSPAAFYNGAD